MEDLPSSKSEARLSTSIALVSPRGAVAPGPTRFVWKKVAGVTSYSLWISGESGLRFERRYTLSELACGETECSVSPAVTLPLGAGSWWARGHDLAGPGPWGTPLSFTVGGAPASSSTLIEPLGPISGVPHYRFSSVPGASSYTIWVTPATGANTQTLVSASTLGCAQGGTCAITLADNVPPPGLTRWWVQAKNGQFVGPWSIAGNYVSGAVQLIPTAPTGTANAADPTFVWPAAAGATQYVLHVSGASIAPIQRLYPASSVCSTGAPTCSTRAGLSLSKGEYRFWVQPQYGAMPGPWSCVTDFGVN